MQLPKVGDYVVLLDTMKAQNNWPFGTNPVQVFRTLNADEFEIVGSDEAWDRRYFEPEAKPATALSTQIGGDHYKSLTIQPIEYITKNNLGWCEGNVVKYISRWKQKGQHADLDKVIHYVNLLKELNG